MGHWRLGFQEAKKLKKQGGGYSLFNKYTKIQAEIVKFKNERDEFFKYKKQNFLLPDLIVQKLKKKWKK